MKRFVESFEQFHGNKSNNKPDPNVIDNYDIIFEEALAHIESSVDMEDFVIKEIALVGSRVTGRYYENSDVDLLVEYEGRIKENALENILSDEPFYYEDIKVDYVTLKVGRYGPGVSAIDKWLDQHKEYSDIDIKRMSIF